MIICRAKLCRFLRISTIARHIFTKWTSIMLDLVIEPQQQTIVNCEPKT